VPVAQHFGEPMQPVIPATLGLDLCNRGEDIIEICPGSAMTLAYQMQLALEVEPPRILRMTSIDKIDKRGDGPFRARRKGDPAHGLAVDHGDLLAPPQVFDGRVASRRGDAIGDAAAGAAKIEAEYQARPFRRAPVNEGIDAKRPVQAGQARRDALQVLESGAPHQGAVAENPEVFRGGGGENRHRERVKLTLKLQPRR
jgi:hypothetical protein